MAYRLNLQLFKRSISVLEQKSYRIADWLFYSTQLGNRNRVSCKMTKKLHPTLIWLNFCLLVA